MCIRDSYPIPGEGTEYLLDMLPQCADPAAKNAKETLDERSEQDGAVLLSTTTRFQDAGGYYYTTLYYADPETGELLAMSVTDYIEDLSLIHIYPGRSAYLTADLYSIRFVEFPQGDAVLTIN